MITTGPGWDLRWCGCRPNADPATWEEAAASSKIVATLYGCLCPDHGLASMEQVDHVITDPPYSKNLYTRTMTNAGNIGGCGQDGRIITTTRDLVAAIDLASGRIGAIDDLIVPLAEQWARICRRWVLVFHCDDVIVPWRDALLSAGLSRRRHAVWLKPDPMPQFSGDRPAQDVEHLAIFHAKGRISWHGGGRGGSIVHPRCKGNERHDHPCPKPLGVMSHYVDLFTDPGELICDPFAGSGTTGVACIHLGRRFIGWERDPAFFEVARKRLECTREQFQIFDASPTGKQGKLF